MTPSTKALLAAALVAPLALAACGKDDSAETDATTSAAASSTAASSTTEKTTTSTTTSEKTTTSTTTTEETTTSEESTTEETTSEEPSPEPPSTPAPQPTSSAPAPQPSSSAPAPAPVDPNAAANRQMAVPELTGPNQATDADRSAIRDVMARSLSGPNVQAVMLNAFNNTCDSVLAQAGGREAAVNMVQQNIPPVPIPPGGEGRIDNVDNVIVNGNEATAVVTATANFQTNTEKQYFVREGDRWLLCGKVPSVQ
ncbi:hypothetical protein ACFSSC_11505 [Corynebacterium mendelii]|uniref:Nuclear transport factor 2 family protein n=1 Tax=Corynebacterium mendelii TaxID=2765362 RepID=A0A939E0J2_9CORY|nr:hypothetical protein [Corynebacterium mendelii]MBN9643623.1 hypothetical protein [Corynebacterium mendelii]